MQHKQQAEQSIDTISLSARSPPSTLAAGGGSPAHLPSLSIVRRISNRKSAFYRNATFKPKPDPLFKPNLDLPKFDGNIRQYGPFREAFDYVIGLDPGMRPLHKLLHLRQLLSGEPLTLALLDKTYGNKARLLFTLQQDLYNTKPPSEEPSDLRRFHDELDRIQSSLRYAGETLDSGHLKWATVLVKKLPTPLRVKLVETYGYNPYNFSAAAFLECLDSYVTTLEWATKDLLIEERPDEAPTQHSVAVDTSDLSGPQCRDDPELPRIEPAPQRVAMKVVNTIADENFQERRTCALCGLLHSAADCTVYDTTNRRLRRAMKLNLCLLCLREGHPAVSCPRRTTRPCPTCRRGQHNRALCKNANQRNDRHPSQ
ncbi:gag protein, partial [Aphelenchoides avenae]